MYTPNQLRKLKSAKGLAPGAGCCCGGCLATDEVFCGTRGCPLPIITLAADGWPITDWPPPTPCMPPVHPIPIPVPGPWGWLIPMFWDHPVAELAACGCGLAAMFEDQPIKFCGKAVDCPWVSKLLWTFVPWGLCPWILLDHPIPAVTLSCCCAWVGMRGVDRLVWALWLVKLGCHDDVLENCWFWKVLVGDVCCWIEPPAMGAVVWLVGARGLPSCIPLKRPLVVEPVWVAVRSGSQLVRL